MRRLLISGSLFVSGFCLILAPAAVAETSESTVSFNTSAQTPAAQQPAGGSAFTYPMMFSGGALDGCKGNVAETLYGRDEGAWGVYRVETEVTCDDGGFSYISSGAWDENGFKGGGPITDGSGTGRFEGIAGPIAQLDGTVKPAADNTMDIEFRMLIDAPSR
jgi:hypothetical protein